MKHDRYALLTVDTEALPKRATGDHVKRLIWGEYANGTAGIREMCSIGDEVGAKHVFFVDMCGAYHYRDEMHEVIAWLDGQGQDVQLHAHPEYLPIRFWRNTSFSVRPQHMNKYGDDAKAEFVISFFSKMLSSLTGKKIRAFRAGSFRWNAGTLRALAKVGIPLSFNNSMHALDAGQCLYSIPSDAPFQWSNGIIEVPVTERNFLPKVGNAGWARLQYPVSHFTRCRPWWRSFLPYSVSSQEPFLVYLLHSWSLLHWDDQGHGMYVDDNRIEGYRKLLRRLAKDYDIITTADLLELLEQGKIAPTHTEDIARAELPAAPKDRRA